MPNTEKRIQQIISYLSELLYDRIESQLKDKKSGLFIGYEQAASIFENTICEKNKLYI